jgi:hypothetical protein
MAREGDTYEVSQEHKKETVEKGLKHKNCRLEYRMIIHFLSK